MVTQSEIDRARYEERFKAEMDALYLQNEAKRDREKLDRLKRLEEEMVRMENRLVEAQERAERSHETVRNQTVRTIEFCQKLLGVVKTPREDLLKLSLPELQQFAEQLQDQVDAR